jgi:prepilin-type processing-associated H-X9-DG protein
MYPSTREDMAKSFPNPVTGRGVHPRWGLGVGWLFRSRDLNAYYQQGQDLNWDEVPKIGYIPRVDLAGAPAEKVFVADGSRYSGPGNGEQPDYYGNIYAGWGGAFSDVGPYSAEYSRSWSRVAAGGGNDPRIFHDPRTWSYRHGKKEPFLPLGNYKMNVGFFDNHVETMNDITSANPHLWLPRGFRLQKHEGNIAADVLEKYFRPEDTYLEIR